MPTHHPVIAEAFRDKSRGRHREGLAVCKSIERPRGKIHAGAVIVEKGKCLAECEDGGCSRKIFFSGRGRERK